MSAPLFPEDILFTQRLLRAEGLYQGTLDGAWGKQSDAAMQQHESQSAAIKTALGSFDSRSEGNIATLALRAQHEARLFLKRVLSGGLTVHILSGTRTYEAQNALYQQGRNGNPGAIVTKAKGGQSNHNFGIAWDIGIFNKEGGYLADGPEYPQAAKLGLTEDLEWGGNWTSIVDKPHYQLKLALSLTQLRTAFETGAPIAGYLLK